MGFEAKKLVWFSISLAALAILPGCATTAGELFPKLENAPVWPEKPETPRIRYVGQISTSGDLRPGKDFGQSLAESLFGKKPELRLLTPYAVCSDGADRLFVADGNGQTVHVIDLARRRWTMLQPGTPSKRFGRPVGVAYDPSSAGTLFVADSTDGCVYTFTAGEKYIAAIGRDYFTRPCGVAFDRSAKQLLVVDAGAHQLLTLSPDGRLIRRIGGRGTQPGEFNFPTNVAIDPSGTIYVSDSLNFRVQQFDRNLTPLRTIGKKGDMPGYFSQPKGLAADAENHLYVVDANFESVQVFDADGRLLLSFGEEGRGPGEFWLPAGIFIDAAKNRIWVADTYNKRLQAFDYLPLPPSAPTAAVTTEVPR